MGVVDNAQEAWLQNIRMREHSTLGAKSGPYLELADDGDTGSAGESTLRALTISSVYQRRALLPRSRHRRLEQGNKSLGTLFSVIRDITRSSSTYKVIYSKNHSATALCRSVSTESYDASMFP